ncbi:P2X purinoceptor 7-like [Amphibalanus amphitrite]|uniref:P2X purinoceptor 7-like n=1 Tax=Amphibalanus amphitrite TaxID=1232801 RepID=UPI001C9205BB|nr:P2X purinoceptor 7-like [Amphibalanus amphitrite]XP_043246615.1 P2X purinoceptor 7-like [Amphibalanus amphitrite]XP_043246617.1 P2X purinoceptor 7-like [Amphibalanus amphitrite]
MSEEERLTLLRTILMEEPAVRWRHLGRPGTALPGPAPQPRAEWCCCGMCPEMPTEQERLCCGETRCITDDPEFVKATQDTFHLTLGVRYHRDRWGEAAPDPADLEGPHRQCRYQAYRHFVLWQWGALGRGNRRALPACAVTAIRAKYPSPSGRYTGFKDVPL